MSVYGRWTDVEQARRTAGEGARADRGWAAGVAEAAALIGVGERQVRRLLSAYQRDGPRGIIHGNRGRKPAHATSEDVLQQVLALAAGKYAGVNHSHLAELLAEREGLALSRPSLQRVLTAAGLSSPRPQRRRSRHRARRERYPEEGMLLQIAASLHRWFGPDLPHVTLLGVIDDATGKVPAAYFQPTEDARGYLTVLRQVVCRTGVPAAIYSDRHSIFWPTNGESLKEQLAGRRSPTQFGRAMAELGIQLIAAHSPQAKGRVERLWGTLQDRLVSELRLAEVTTSEQANAFLPAFLARFNRRFAVAPEESQVAYGPRLSTAERTPPSASNTSEWSPRTMSSASTACSSRSSPGPTASPTPRPRSPSASRLTLATAFSTRANTSQPGSCPRARLSSRERSNRSVTSPRSHPT